MKSIGLFLLSVKYIQQRRFLPYLLLMTLAFMFHSSTLFLFPLYFVPRTLPRQCFIVVFVVGNLLYLSQIAYMAPLISEGGRLLGGKYAALTGAYLNSDLYAQARGISIGYLERTLTFVLVVLFIKNSIPANMPFLEHVPGLFVYKLMDERNNDPRGSDRSLVFTLLPGAVAGRCAVFYIKIEQDAVRRRNHDLLFDPGIDLFEQYFVSIRQCPSDGKQLSGTHVYNG